MIPDSATLRKQISLNDEAQVPHIGQNAVFHQ